MANKMNDQDDAAAIASTALGLIEKLQAEIDALPKKIKLSREAWRDYGQALLSKRQKTPSTKKFGEWVRSHGLDKGLASSPTTRSDAMWLANFWEEISALSELKASYPSAVRQECRALGYEWAADGRKSGRPISELAGLTGNAHPRWANYRKLSDGLKQMDEWLTKALPDAQANLGAANPNERKADGARIGRLRSKVDELAEAHASLYSDRPEIDPSYISSNTLSPH